jgi:ribosomal protein L19E
VKGWDRNKSSKMNEREREMKNTLKKTRESKNVSKDPYRELAF